MEDPWWGGLTDSTILSNCVMSTDYRKKGRLMGTTRGVNFRYGESALEFPWSEISDITITRTESNKQLVTRITITGLRPSEFHTFEVTASDLATLGIIENRRDAIRAHRPASGFAQSSFAKSTYLGGLPETSSEITGELTFAGHGLAIDGRQILQWNECSGIVIESIQVAKGKLKATLVFGALGALAAKGTKSQAVITVKRDDGATAYFVIDNISSHEVKAKISPLLDSVKIPILNEWPTVSAPSRDLVSEIERLVELRNSGNIDDDEFKQMKAKMLE